MHRFDIICISESYLNSDTSSSDDNLNIPDYNTPRTDHPVNRRGGVCIYYKESMPIKMLIINYLQECICFDLKIGSPPPYERHIWHYKHANTDMSSKAIQGFDWEKAFLEY